MNRNSAPVSSSQSGVHARLDSVVRRHLQTVWQKPLHAPTVDAFNRLIALPDFDPDRGIVLDSGCGTGSSTKLLAAQHPDHQVIGVDRSAARLSRLRRRAEPQGPCEGIGPPSRLSGRQAPRALTGSALETRMLFAVPTVARIQPVMGPEVVMSRENTQDHIDQLLKEMELEHDQLFQTVDRIKESIGAEDMEEGR